MLSDENVQRYAKALYPLAFLLVLVPLADVTLRGFPPQFGTLQWRFATVGLVLGNLGTVLLGLGLTGLLAALCGHRKGLRAVGIVALIAAVVILAMLVLFGLDAVQLRRLAAPNFKRVILVSSAGAAFTGIFATVTLLVMGRGALAASRAGRIAAPAARAKAAAKAAPSTLVVTGAPTAPVGATAGAGAGSGEAV